MTAFELAVQDAHGVEVARRVRPDRIEVCAALRTGGVTPSAGLIDQAVSTGLAVHVLIRPREGGFEYGTDEVDLIVRDAQLAVERGAAGVVVGGIMNTAAGPVLDADLVRAVVGVARGREVTLHRAFDMIANPTAALAQLGDLGVTRVLSSGGASRAVDALDQLRELTDVAQGHIQIMAGAGVTSSNARRIAATGVTAVHASAKRRVVDRLPISLGSAALAGEVDYETTDEDEARSILAALRNVDAT